MDDYHFGAVETLATRAVADNDPIVQAAADILATEVVIRIAYQLRFGKVNPEGLDADWNFERSFLPEVDPVRAVTAITAAEDMVGELKQRLARGPLYRQIMVVLLRYRSLAANGGWPRISEGESLRAGDRSPRVLELRQRLAISEPGASALGAEPELFDDELADWVSDFQRRHNLTADGVVGKKTVAALNVPVEQRIDQMRATLERARWVFNDMRNEGDFVLVNIAGFRLALFRNNAVEWITPVVVGKQYHETPVFTGSMKYLVLNPTWTIPASIAKNEMLPKIQKDPGYLGSRNISVLGRNGEVIDASTIDWAKLSKDRLPYTLRQGAGKGNALGQVKFMFPNKHAVYLHDTPSRSLFDRASRAFSHGCVRVNDPLTLAAKVLPVADGWSRIRIDEVVASGETKTVKLAKSLPVFILYRTASVGQDGKVRFFEDIYQRDARLLKALDGKVRIEVPAAVL